ncbi:uncharacterized protein LOC144212111 [Stigmatopora nigra]
MHHFHPLYLLLLLPVSCSLSPLSSHQDPLPLPPPAPKHAVVLQPNQGTTNHLNAKPTPPVDQGSSKVGVFIAAAVGTCTLMAAVYCIYNKFYNKQPYLHTYLREDQDPHPDLRPTGYGTLSDTPSVISAPPYLSPPPSSMPFPSFLRATSSGSSSGSFRSISAKDLQQSCI